MQLSTELSQKPGVEELTIKVWKGRRWLCAALANCMLCTSTLESTLSSTCLQMDAAKKGSGINIIVIALEKQQPRPPT